MKRDMDLIRELLLQIEAKHDGSGRAVKLVVDDRQEDEITEHLFQIWEAGFIEARDASSMSGRDIIVLRITWLGHDFLDSVRDEEIWKKTKEGAEAAGGFTLDLLKDLAKGFIKTQIKNKTGIEV